MKFFQYLSIAAIAAGASLVSAQDKPANHLVLSEVLIDSNLESATGSAEYAEIFNPTDNAISLDNYYLTDQAQFYNFPIFQSQVPPINNDLGGGDYIFKFPAGYSIPSGGVVVVCWHSTSFLTDFFANNLATFTGQAGNPQLFETGVGANARADVPNMITYNSNADANSAVNFSHTNAGEYLCLAYWNGNSDLVQDVDVVSWGSKTDTGGDTPPQRDGLSSDGPDAGDGLTDYFFDNGLATRNIDVDPSFDPNSLVRRTTIEIGEFGVTGNGNLGQDETTEWCWDTWAGGEGNGGTASDEDFYLTPGLPGPLVKTSDIPTPAVGAVSRSEKDPTPGSAFTITCRAGSVNTPTVKLYLSVNGAAYTSSNMTYNPATVRYEKSVGPYPAATSLKYYFEAVDGAKTGRYPYNNPGGLFPPYENDYFTINIRAGGALTDSDIILNEIQFNPAGGDNTTNAEWTEVYNNTAAPIDVSGGHYSDFATNSERCAIPAGAIVPAHGFIILCSNKTAFLNLYNTLDPSKVFDMHDIRTNALPGHNNDKDTPMISSANDYRWGNRPTAILDTFAYDDSTLDPTWPNMKTTAGGVGNTGRTDELKSPTLDNTVGSNWAISINPTGSPLAVNQQAAVADWSVY